MADNQFQDTIRPQVGDGDISIPITFGYNGGRAESSKSRVLAAWVISIAGIILWGFMLFGRSSSGLITRLIVSSIVGYVIFLFVRYALLREGYYRRIYEEQEETDYYIGYEDVWGIVDIEDNSYHTCHFKNGLIGALVYFEKDVIVGKSDDDEFEHFEAVSEAFNYLGEVKARVLYTDYMAEVGYDSRFRDMYSRLNQSKNKELVSLYNKIYANLEQNLINEVTTYDVYCILVPSTEARYETIFDRFVSLMMSANYVGYSYLGPKEMGNFIADLFGMGEFSVIEAQERAVTVSTNSIARAIMLEDGKGNRTKLGNTLAEEAEEAARLRREKALIEKEKKARKVRSKRKTSNKVEEDNLVEL